jgi:hypothetical protein
LFAIVGDAVDAAVGDVVMGDVEVVVVVMTMGPGVVLPRIVLVGPDVVIVVAASGYMTSPGTGSIIFGVGVGAIVGVIVGGGAINVVGDTDGLSEEEDFGQLVDVIISPSIKDDVELHK